MLRIISLIIKAIFVAYLIIFSVSNVNTVTFKPLMNVVTYNIPLFLLVIITLFVGIVIGALFVWSETLSLKSQIRKLNKEIKNGQQEIERLQKLTISQEPVQVEENKQEKTAEENPAAAAQQNDIKDALR